MKRKITGILFLFYLVNLGLFGQSVKMSTNLPESLSPGQSYDMEVNIDKGGASMFAKFQMDLPFGFSASPIELKSGNWTFDQQRAKIVWVSIPNEQQFTVKMKVTVPDNALNTCVITAKFFYLENNVKKEYEMTPHNLKISGSAVTSTNPVTTNTVATTNTTTTTNPVTTNTVATTNTVSTSTTNTVSTSNQNTNTSISPATNTAGVVYRVQIGAFSVKPAKSKFPGIKEFWVYEDNGLFKATAGVFKTLNEAEAYKAQLRSQGMDGFVVAFQNGMRIKLP